MYFISVSCQIEWNTSFFKFLLEFYFSCMYFPLLVCIKISIKMFALKFLLFVCIKMSSLDGKKNISNIFKCFNISQTRTRLLVCSHLLPPNFSIKEIQLLSIIYFFIQVAAIDSLSKFSPEIDNLLGLP